MAVDPELAARSVHAVAADASTMADVAAEMTRHLARAVPHEGYLLIGLDPITYGGSFRGQHNSYSGAMVRRLSHDFVYHDGWGLLDDPLPVRVHGGETGHRLPDYFRPRLREMTAEGVGSEMGLPLIHHGRTVGALLLLRENGSRPFSFDDARHLRQFRDPFASALRHFVASKPLRRARPPARPPGVVVVGADDTIRAATASAWHVLGAFVSPEERDDEQEVFSSVWKIVYLVRRTGAPAVTHVPSPFGWLALDAQPLAGQNAGDIAVTLEPATGEALLPTIAAWYHLTPREQGVVRALLRGEPTRRVARDLHLSPHTLNDHMKAIYRKTGVTSRDELIAGLT
ncbi:response regulator transcription factor [Streptoalloteichus hindustanus]|uniref:response regulator transcription factor n=1 Tax=Streptoalloteichus hindustanus TaxID=2017 RepID=UPI001161085F|nr:helix-turn-helix transcriptional regulator [Streptoalloteichus hindustanus]